MTAVTRLCLTDFRNHRDALIEAANGFVLLSGPNGAAARLSLKRTTLQGKMKKLGIGRDSA